MIFQYGLEPVLIQRILIGFEAKLEINFSILAFHQESKRDKTMDDKLICIRNDNKHNQCRLKLNQSYSLKLLNSSISPPSLL